MPFQVGSWGAYLLKKNILAMSFAPRDTHVSQIQFALERGVPAILGIMATNRMPYPARAFDMAHCSRCLIPWGGLGKFFYVSEQTRVLSGSCSSGFSSRVGYKPLKVLMQAGFDLSLLKFICTFSLKRF